MWRPLQETITNFIRRTIKGKEKTDWERVWINPVSNNKDGVLHWLFLQHGFLPFQGRDGNRIITKHSVNG